MAKSIDYIDIAKWDLDGANTTAQTILQSLGEFLFVASFIKCFIKNNNNNPYSSQKFIFHKTNYKYSSVFEYRQDMNGICNGKLYLIEIKLVLKFLLFIL